MEKIKSSGLKFIAFILPIFIAAFAMAQEKVAEVNVDVDKGGGGAWYASPVFG